MPKTRTIDKICLNEFNELYFNQKHSMRMVAAHFGVPHESLMYFTRKHNIQLRSKSESVSLAFSSKRRDINGSKNSNYRHGKLIGASKGNRWAKYGLSKAEFEQLKILQKEKCAICNSEFLGKTPDIDHCHKTGKVRGLLCSNCNRCIGLLKDNIDVLQNAILYLSKARW